MSAARGEKMPPYTKLAFYSPVRDYPAVADNKATALLAAFGLMTSVLIFFSEPLDRILRTGEAFSAVPLIALLLPLALLEIAGLRAAVTALVLPAPPMPESLAYFEHIAGRDRPSFSRDIRTRDYAAAARDMLVYNHTISVLCAAKFRAVDRGVACLRASFVIWLLLLLRVAAGV